MATQSNNTLAIDSWLDTLPADFDPSQSHVPPRKVDAKPGLRPPLESGLRLEEAIGEGGMAMVHRGTQLSLHREVAIKVKKGALSGNSDEIWSEAWLTSALEHPNIVPIYDLSIDEVGDPMVVMRRIDGTEWGKLFREPEQLLRDFGASDAMDWHLHVFLQVCNAVHYAHSMGVMHRDIKPANVMIGIHGQVYLLDWGIAVGLRGPIGEKLNQLRGSAEPAGTPCYLAPEMLSGESAEMDERTDVYLLGATLFHYLTGKPPHLGKSLEDVLLSVMNDQVHIPDDLPGELQTILHRCLASKRAERYADVAELRRAVTDFLSHRSSYQLEEQAGDELDKLQDALSRHKLDNAADRTELYKHYSSCRTAYRAALQLWPGNPTATAGLYTATSAMIDAEIHHGTPRAATALLSDLSDPPEELVCRVSDAQYSEDLAHTDMQHLANVARKWSSEHGARLRVTIVMLVGFIYGAYAMLVSHYSPTTTIINDAVGLTCLLLYWVIMRRQDNLSAFNASAVIAVGLVFALQIARNGVALALDTPPEAVLLHSGLLYVSIVATSAACLEHRLWPASVAYGLAYVLVLLGVVPGGLAYGLCHVFFSVNTGWIWWPRREEPVGATKM